MNQSREARGTAAAQELIAARQLEGSRVLALAVVVIALVSLPFVVGITALMDYELGVRLLAVNVGAGLYFGAMLWLIRRGFYRPWLDWVNTAIEVSTPTVIALIDTARIGPAYALTSAPVMLFVLVGTLAALRLRPRLALFAGLVGATELAVLYFAIRGGITPEQVQALPSLGMSNVLQRAAYVAIGGLSGYWLCKRFLTLVDRLVAEHAARDALHAEMEVAQRIQTALLPPNGRLGDYEVAAVMRPAAQVGGDYYEILPTRAGEHWVAIGDVSGHGVESGLVMMMAQSSFLTQVQDVGGRRPSEVFHAVNGVVYENARRLKTSRYMTLNLIRVHPDRLVIAGKHQDVLVHRSRTRRVEVVSNEGSWAGVVPDTRGCVEDSEIPLEAGDTALFFTDGVTEATAASGELFGQERLERAFAAVAERPVEEALEALLREVQGFQSAQDDDVTLMLLRRAPAASAPVA